MVLFEYTGHSAFAVAASVLAAIAVAIFSFGVRASRVVFVLIAIALVLWAALTNTGWMAATALAAERGAMVMALFAALTAIRNAAISAPAIVECGRFLARHLGDRKYGARAGP